MNTTPTPHQTQLAHKRITATQTNRTQIHKTGCWHITAPGKPPQPVATHRLAIQLATTQRKNTMPTIETTQLHATQNGTPTIRKINGTWICANPNTWHPTQHPNFQSALRQANRINRKAMK